MPNFSVPTIKDKIAEVVLEHGVMSALMAVYRLAYAHGQEVMKNTAAGWLENGCIAKKPDLAQKLREASLGPEPQLDDSYWGPPPARPKPSRPAEPSGWGGPVARTSAPLAATAGRPRPPPMSVMPKPAAQPSKPGSILARAKAPEPDPVSYTEHEDGNAVTIHDVKIMKEAESGMAVLLNIGGRQKWFPNAMIWSGSTISGVGDEGDLVTSMEIALDKGLLG